MEDMNDLQETDEFISPACNMLFFAVVKAILVVKHLQRIP